MIVQIKFRRGTAAEWTSANPTLASGEPGYETDTGFLKLGDGSTAWNTLDYLTTSGGGGGGAVDSVNGQTGVVVLDASDVGAALATHAHPVGDITNLVEFIQDTAANMIVAGTNITKTYDDSAGTVTLTGAAGGSAPVTSVNGKVGVVVLNATDVGGTAAGTAVLLTTNQTAAGNKTWTGTQTFNAGVTFASTVSMADGSLAIADTSGLQSVLDSKMGSTDDIGTLSGTLEIPQMLANTPLYHFYNTVTSTWPNRPTARTDIVVVWVGPTQPTVGGTGMLAGKDFLALTP